MNAPPSTAASGALADIADKRVILVTGKGGVGRTTVAAALGMAGARLGRRTLVLDLGDPEGGGSHLAGLFAVGHFTTEPQPLAPNLHGMHLWAPTGHDMFLRDILPGGAIIGQAVKSKALQTFLQAAPSFLEMGWFNHLLTVLRDVNRDGELRHELIIIDLPATGHTLALTGLPDLLRRLIRTGPVIERLNAGHDYLRDPTKSVAWVVTLPETLPVSESLDLLAGLRTTGINVGAVALNRVPHDPFNETERSQLTPLLERGNVLGAIDFARMHRAHRADARLRSEIDMPLVSLPELLLSGRELVAALSQSLVPVGVT